MNSRLTEALHPEAIKLRDELWKQEETEHKLDVVRWRKEDLQLHKDREQARLKWDEKVRD